MEETRRLVRLIAPTDATVLITGETGTGKEVVARALHAASSREGRPFVAINCAALAPGVVESELFGHEKGAFSGADSPRIGVLESARNGTVFLDEIADMDLAIQAKLLRALEQRTVVPVGGRERGFDARIVVASNTDLAGAVRAGSFRADLYYRIAVAEIALAPLRYRLDDIGSLFAHFARGRLTLTDDGLHALTRYPWPGNVRELRNLVDRLAIFSEETVVSGAHVSRFLAHMAAATSLPPGVGLDARLRDFETAEISAALAACGGTVARAAEALSMKRSTLSARIRKLGIEGVSDRARSTPRLAA
jgi:DNA-binding NtrC family response regulator